MQAKAGDLIRAFIPFVGNLNINVIQRVGHLTDISEDPTGSSEALNSISSCLCYNIQYRSWEVNNPVSRPHGTRFPSPQDEIPIPQSRERHCMY